MKVSRHATSHFTQRLSTLKFPHQIENEWNSPTLCLAVWPIANYDGFHVVLMTQNPSLLKLQENFFD